MLGRANAFFIIHATGRPLYREPPWLFFRVCCFLSLLRVVHPALRGPKSTKLYCFALQKIHSMYFPLCPYLLLLFVTFAGCAPSLAGSQKHQVVLFCPPKNPFNVLPFMPIPKLHPCMFVDWEVAQ